MAQVTEPQTEVWTAVALAERFGPIPLSRIRTDPPPGTATEQDVVDIEAHQDRLCELVDGVLVQKAVGAHESCLAMAVGEFLRRYARENRLGIVLGEAGMLRLAPGLVRIPDVSFISMERLPGGHMPRDPIADLVPDLAVEVISRSNTRQEMAEKLADYFRSGTRLVWCVWPDSRQVSVYTSPDQYTVFDERQTLDGGDVLPGFRLDVKEIFAEPAG